MLKTFCVLALTLILIAANPLSQKRVAKIDEIQIDLSINDLKSFNRKIEQHQNQAFMINVEQSEQASFGVFEVHLQNADKDKVTCTFNYPTNLCVLQKCTQSVSISVKCLKQKCKAKLSLSHRMLYHLSGGHSNKMLHVPGQIYKVEKQNTRSLIEIYLLKQEDRLLQTDVKIFSNVHVFKLSQVEELDTNSLRFGVKPIITNNDQYFYVEGDHTQKTKDMQFNIITHFDKLRQGVTIFDFIETFGRPSNNTYQYLAQFTKNIQVKVKIFEPKEYKDLPFSITLKGKSGTNYNETLTTISKLELTPVEFAGHKFYDIVFVTTKSKHQNFKAIFVQLGILKAAERAIFIQITLSDVATSDIFIFDHVYFSTNANEQLKFSVSPQVKYKIIGLDKQISILRKANQKYKINTQTCSLHKGCQITLQAQDICQSCSFAFDLQKEDIKNSIIYYEVKDDKVEAKIDFEQELYFKYKIEPYNYSQIIVDSVNVVIFAQFQNYQRCKVPSSVCHQFAISQQNPIIVHNEDNHTQNLVVNIVGLQRTSFKLRFINQINGLEVNLGQKFTYLFDSSQESIKVKFSVNNQTFKEKDEHLYFNLVAPLGYLLLNVRNGNTQMSSNDGYIQFSKKSIKGNDFQIRISKVNQALSKKYVHMTLMVTTANSGAKLDATTTHYEKYLPFAQKKLYMEYEPSQRHLINIYTQNLQRSRSTMKLRIRDLNLEKVDSKNKPFIQKLLERDNEVVDLDIQLQNLDICDEINCELEISIQSQSKFELEQTITLIHEQSVIALDDSIWNSFQVNQLSVSNHFFFIPRDPTKAVTILFSTEDRNLYIDYLVHNTRSNPNPQAWPWDRRSLHSESQIGAHLTGFQQFKIQKEEFKQCGDTCVILISLNQANKESKKSQLIKSYKILASSTIIQVPQDLKFHITMKTNQENAMFIDIKNFLKAERLTFFTEYRLGRAKIVITLVSKGVEYPINIEGTDFVFYQLQTHLPIESITGALKRHNLKPEQSLLKINIVALSTLKMYFQFTSKIKNLYRLNMDDLEVCTLKVGEEIWYEFVPERDFQIKFYRISGFPLFKIIKCQEQNYIQCLSQHQKAIVAEVNQKISEKQRTKEDIKQAKKKDIQILNTDTVQQTKQLIESTVKELEVFIQKNYEYTGQQCEQCIFYIWVYGYVEGIQLSINIRSSKSQVELKEMAVINDRISTQKQHRKYLINAQPSSSTIVTFRIMEGSCHVQITDNQKLLHSGSYQQGKKADEDITIAGLGLPTLRQDSQADYLAELQDVPSVLLQARKIQSKHHILRHLHVKVTSNSTKPIEYLISYSIGYSGVFLQDGSLYEKHMVPGLIHNFYYHNKEKNSHPYLSLSSSVDPGHAAEQSKNEFQAKFYYYPDANNRTVKEEFRPELPPKKNANLLGQMLTHVYQLPAIYELFQIQVFTKSFIKLTASVNHKEVVYLPVGFEYLIKLHVNQSINLIINRPPSDYLGLVIKKCDDSVPNLMYTNDVKEFQKSIYEAREDIYNNYEKKMIKTKKDSKTIHIKITAEEFKQSLLTITVVAEHDPQKYKSQKVKAGNNGLLSYKTLDSNKVEVEFSPITCESNNCAPLSPQYYLLLAQNMSNIYGQLYCAGNYFVSKYKQKSEIQTSMVIALLPKHYYKDTNTYRYELILKQQQEFIAVKVMYTENYRVHEIIYLPTAITTFWRQMNKIPVAFIIVFALVFVILLMIVVIVSTKLARRGYKPIAESQ